MRKTALAAVAALFFAAGTALAQEPPDPQAVQLPADIPASALQLSDEEKAETEDIAVSSESATQVQDSTGIIGGTISHVMRYTTKMHDSISKSFLGTVDRVDNYFGNRYYVKDQQKSAAVVTLDCYQTETAFSLRPSVNAKISLPGTEDRFHVLVEHVQERAMDKMSALERVRNSQDYLARTLGSNPDADGDNSATFIGVSYARKLTSVLANHADVGVNYSFLPKPWELPKPYASYNLDLSTGIGDFLIRQDNQVFWQYQKDAGYSGALVLTYKIDEDLLLESEFDGNRTFINPNWSMLETVSLNWIASDRDILTPMFQTTMNSMPAVSASMYTVAVNWRRRLYENWLFFGLAPQIDYPRSKAFEPQYRLTLSLEIVFGFSGQS